MQAARLANQLGGREAVWLAARLVCWLARWTCCSNFVPFGNLSSPYLFLSLSFCLHPRSFFFISSSVSPNFVLFSLACLLSAWLKTVAVAEPKKWSCKLPSRTMATPPTPYDSSFPRRCSQKSHDRRLLAGAAT